jgi:hypothetical protein
VLSRAADVTFVQSKHDGLEAQIDLPAIQASLKLADVFEGLNFDDRAEGASR